MKEGLLDPWPVRRTETGDKDPRHRAPAGPEKKWEALKWLFYYREKQRFPLEEWEDAVSFLLGCQVRFENYREVNQSLKPFSLEVR